MAGHSKWANIQHKKGANDKKRAKIFTKIIRELTVATKEGGGSPDGNPRLRSAILKAKEANMPKDTIEKAIKKGSGEAGGANYDEFTYEGYGPDGVAIFMEIMTDNKNRTSSDVKSTLSKAGGNLGANGCVSYIFHKKGVIIFDADVITEDSAMEIAVEAGGDDVVSEDGNVIVYTSFENFEAVLNAFDEKGIQRLSAEVTMIPDTYQEVAEDKVEKVLALIDRLEDLDDIQAVYTNLKIPDNYSL